MRQDNLLARLSMGFSIISTSVGIGILVSPLAFFISLVSLTAVYAYLKYKLGV